MAAAPGGTTVGLFVQYVDDILAVGQEEVLEGFCTRMKEEWEVGEPDWVTPDGPPVRFMGMEIELKDQTYRVHQKGLHPELAGEVPRQKVWIIGLNPPTRT